MIVLILCPTTIKNNSEGRVEKITYAVNWVCWGTLRGRKQEGHKFRTSLD